MKLPEDLEQAVRQFIRQCAAPETFTHLAAELRSRFGLDLSAQEASDLWRTDRRPRAGRPPRFENNAALMAFIADRADLMTIDRLHQAARQAFGRDAPSRTHLHRLVLIVRAKARAASGFGRR